MCALGVYSFLFLRSLSCVGLMKVLMKILVRFLAPNSNMSLSMFTLESRSEFRFSDHTSVALMVTTSFANSCMRPVSTLQVQTNPV